MKQFCDKQADKFSNILATCHIIPKFLMPKYVRHLHAEIAPHVWNFGPFGRPGCSEETAGGVNKKTQSWTKEKPAAVEAWLVPDQQPRPHWATRVSRYMSVCLSVRLSVCMPVCMYAGMQACTYANIHIYVHTYVYIYIYVFMYTCLCMM